MSKNPLISVCVPVYNTAAYLRECIDSILSQSFEDFELLIGDDGSTDNSVDVALSYSDPRIRVLKCPHDYIGTLNTLLDEAKGQYIARMDSDDVMPIDRLEYQYKYMEAHPSVAAMSGSLCVLDESTSEKQDTSEFVYDSLLLLKCNYMVNPASIFRKDIISKHGIRYEDSFIYAEDYHFWAQIILHNLVIHIVPKILVKYRLSETQISCRYRHEMECATQRVKEYIRKNLAIRSNINYIEPTLIKSKNKITVIIPFVNEGKEVFNTVKSVRETAGDKVDIIVCNDQSTDNYDYSQDLVNMHVYYFFNKERKGVAGTRDYCISVCNTPYFILLDAHMRFYSNNWVDVLTTLLEQNERVLLCCQGKALQKENDTVEEMKDVPSYYGALMPFDGNDLTKIEWRLYETSPNRTEEIPAVLGAGYAASKKYWTYLNGLKGLRSYGSDEQFISLKVWLEGGKCLLVKDVVIGHIYRKSSPFERNVADEFFNKILIAKFFFPLSWRCRLYANLIAQDGKSFHQAYESIVMNSEFIKDLVDFQHDIQNKPFHYFLEVNRKLCPYKFSKSQAMQGRLREIATYLLKEEYVDAAGICNGYMGHIIWFSHYNQLYPDKQIEEHIDRLWREVAQQLKEERLPLNFKYGLWGIGWALIYLDNQGFLDDSPEELLAIIDRNIEFINPLALTDESIHFGLGGILLYVNARIQTSDKLRKGNIPFSPDFMKSLSQRVLLMLDNNKAEDIQLSYSAIKFKVLTSMSQKEDKSDIKLSCTEWLTFKDFIPVNLAYGDKGLEGNVMTTSLYFMLTESITTSTYE